MPKKKVTKAFVYSVFKTINKLTNYHETYNQIETLSSLQAIYKQIIDLAEVSFEGEPLSGLQVMGVLESRVLDFENVIITSVNEGKFPAGKSQNSFIPYDVKRIRFANLQRKRCDLFAITFIICCCVRKTFGCFITPTTKELMLVKKKSFHHPIGNRKQPKHNIISTIYNAFYPKKHTNPLPFQNR